MSLNQSKFGKNESQFRKAGGGRSCSGSGGQQRPFFGGRRRGGVGPPSTATKPYVSSNRSYKKVVNPQSGQSGRNVGPVNTSNFNSQSSSMSSDSAMSSTPSKGDGVKNFPLQFGSISPSFLNGMQVPARTSLTSPNLDEQKRDQGSSQVTHRAENKHEIGKIYVEEEAKQRKLKGILDKLTPQNFEKLYKQVKEVNIDNVVTLKGVVSQIFEKALMEPTFCEMRLLLNKCQEEFEREEREEQEVNNEGEDEIKQSEELRVEMRLKASRRKLGNIKLIGELYKKKMLTERIMHECIKKLLGTYQNPNEKNIEALCILMSTIGEMIDHPKDKEYMDAYFDIMGQLSNNMKLSSGLRFMLKEAIDLRKNKWQQRRFDANCWQRATNFDKGLMFAPQGPYQVRHRADNKYKIGKIYAEEEAKQRKLKGILDKLTPQNFEKLYKQVKEVKIDNSVTLNGVVSQIFEKALMEPTFCEMYANLCQRLAFWLPELSVDNEKITFRRLLLNKCQEEFEREEREEQEENKADNEGEGEDETKQSEELREEMRLNARRRMLGNIRLIGELYKKKMLTEKVMHECIKNLLGPYQNPNEKNIKALCILMSTIGERIDHRKAKQNMDAYFNIMAQLSNNMKLSSGLRFMLKEAIDLRKNKWQQRRFDADRW
ncbi:eukaryotic translation initiation factor 4G-like isoform X2 [Amaranthus tricolor]|uniref:eukaryotic translation initiation factor 4G-like isoform X2 n=1 Tax=Amaranthus tricolor TaxID=29722 RepID=UPI002590CFF3|nr:eukaryotic translation initiation factor 4G-like isoform X2 [Amaranthus tricolor]